MHRSRARSCHYARNPRTANRANERMKRTKRAAMHTSRHPTVRAAHGCTTHCDTPTNKHTHSESHTRRDTRCNYVISCKPHHTVGRPRKVYISIHIVCVCMCVFVSVQRNMCACHHPWAAIASSSGPSSKRRAFRPRIAHSNFIVEHYHLSIHTHTSQAMCVVVELSVQHTLLYSEFLFTKNY